MRLSFVLALAAGCADGFVQDPIDAGADAAQAPQTISVRVEPQGVPAANARVVFHAADGAPVAIVTTDASGRASGPGIAGGAVTIATDGAPPRLFTFLDVRPGDTLVVGEPWGLAVRALPPVTVTMPPAGVAGAAGYDVTAGCARFAGQPGAQVAVTGDTLCADPRTTAYSVLARAYGAGGQVLAFATARQVGNAGATLPAWGGASPLSLQVAGAPPQTAQMTVRTSLVIDGVHFGQATSVHVAPGGVVTHATTVPSDAAAIDGVSRQVSVNFIAAGNELSALSLFDTQLPLGAAGGRIDLAAALLPRVRSASIDGSDLDRLVVSFGADGPLADADYGRLAVTWAGGGRWVVYFPPGTRVALPRLPPELRAWAPVATDLRVTDVLLQDLSHVGGYDAWRQTAGFPPRGFPYRLRTTSLASR